VSRSHIEIIGAPLDLGQGRRGVDMGPSAVRVANLNARVASLGYEVEDRGNVPVEQAEAAPEGHPHAKYLPQIAATCERLAKLVSGTLGRGNFPVVLGGDHSVAVGTVSGVSHHFRGRGERVGLIWLDAHADMNTPDSSPSGNVHGMPLACIAGLGPPELVDIFGTARRWTRAIS
jgi:arginase